MKKGERAILGGIALFALAAMAWKGFQVTLSKDQDYEIPFFSTASPTLQSKAATLIRTHKCKDCHTLWATRDMLQSVPAPALDGIGSLRSKEWFLSYLSADNPQAILPTRLKPEYRMPSFSRLDETDRIALAEYLSSLKVKDWYLQQAKKAEYEKLTGKEYAE